MGGPPPRRGRSGRLPAIPREQHSPTGPALVERQAQRQAARQRFLQARTTDPGGSTSSDHPASPETPDATY